MAVQLIIDGQHITDVLAQVQQLAYATGGDTSREVTVPKSSTPIGTCNPSPAKSSPSKDVPTEMKADPSVQKLTREEQDAAVVDMTEAGVKDARYDLLTKGRQRNVDDGIAAKTVKEEPVAKEDDLDDMFDEGDVTDEVPVINADTIREMMGKLGKDDDGNPIQDNLVKIRDILTKFVTKGKDIKVGNIPADKLPAVYAELQKLEG